MFVVLPPGWTISARTVSFARLRRASRALRDGRGRSANVARPPGRIVVSEKTSAVLPSDRPTSA